MPGGSPAATGAPSALAREADDGAVAGGAAACTFEAGTKAPTGFGAGGEGPETPATLGACNDGLHTLASAEAGRRCRSEPPPGPPRLTAGAGTSPTEPSTSATTATMAPSTAAARVLPETLGVSGGGGAGGAGGPCPPGPTPGTGGRGTGVPGCWHLAWGAGGAAGEGTLPPPAGGIIHRRVPCRAAGLPCRAAVGDGDGHEDPLPCPSPAVPLPSPAPALPCPARLRRALRAALPPLSAPGPPGAHRPLCRRLPSPPRRPVPCPPPGAAVPSGALLAAVLPAGRRGPLRPVCRPPCAM